MASDVVPGFGPPVTCGNGFHASVVAKGRAGADRACAPLSADGRGTMPLAAAPWGLRIGRCTDRLGVGRVVSLPHPV